MKELELCPDRTKMIVILRVDGTTRHTDRFDPVTVTGRRKVAGAVGVSEAVLLSWIEEAKTGNKKFTVPEAEAGRPECWVRPMNETRETATRYPLDPSRVVKEVLPLVPLSSVLEWSDPEQLCCLDVDYHESPPPDRPWLESVVTTRITPHPLAWHFSRGGGLHLFYSSTPSQSASDLASLAALRFRTLDPTAGLELKTVVRGPGSERVYQLPVQDEAAGFTEWLGAPEYDTGLRDEWLESENMVCGGRYNHDKCPICPTADPGKHRQPVAVSETGIFCFVCEGRGQALGSRRAGWGSWASILGAPSSGNLGSMIRRIAHWGHAKWILSSQYGLSEAFAKAAYRAALRAYHADRPTKDLVDTAFRNDTEDLARANNQWVSLEQSYTYPKDITPLLSGLPVCQWWDGEKVRVNPAAVCEMNQTKDHTTWGYPSINVVHGFRLAGVFCPDGGPTVAVQHSALRKARVAPAYVPRTKRMPTDEAWGVLETVFPRLDRTLVTVAMCAFACAQETQSGMLPMVFVSGSSGSAKTSTLRIAAGIYGARTHDVVHEPEPAKFRQNILLGATECPAVILNEILKDSARGRLRLTPTQALDPLLNLTEDSASWVSYRGPVRMGRLPAVFLTEPVCPMTLREESQLARRIRHHRVFGRKDEWKTTTAAVGLSNFHLVRLVSDSLNRACDAILSDTADAWFSTPKTWDVIADALGVKTIEDSPDFDDLSPYLREFFKLVCMAVDLRENAAKIHGVGYKKITRSEGTPDSEEDTMLSVYTMFADGVGSDWLTSRRLLEKDWSGVLKSEANVWLDLKNDGVNVYARFRDGPPKAPGTHFNQKIVDPDTWRTE
jgi:hypothetical protein